MSNQPIPPNEQSPDEQAARLGADPAQQSLVQALRASFNILRVLMIVLVVLYIFSGVFRVEPGQQGLVARLGKLLENPATESYVFRPGWHWRMLPDPFDQKYIVPGQVQTVTITTFMFQHPEAGTTKDLADIIRASGELEPGRDGAMLTGDKNLSHGRWQVQYQIDDAADFVQNIADTPADFEPLLQRLIETAVVREVAGRTVEEVTREAVDAVRQGVQRRLQRELDELDTGVRVVQIVANTIEPGPVRDAFVDVSRAENERQRLIREAEELATEILSRAAGDQYTELLRLIRAYGDAQLRGEEETVLTPLRAAIDAALEEAEAREAGQVAVRMREARARANEINKRVESEYQEFMKRRQEIAAQPRIALLSQWVQVRERILTSLANEIFFIPDSDEIEILINRDVVRKRQLEQQRVLEQQLRGQPR